MSCRLTSVFDGSFPEDADHFRRKGSGSRYIKRILRFLPYRGLEFIMIKADRLLIGVTEKTEQQ